ncbi:MAG TPA: DNA methyltransferase [Anaerolineae bacterium]|nr:DNA methyltransferase [Anaerolineae bacterium]
MTDPPAGISFMGREWDSDRGGRRAWVAWATRVFAECLRVCKPGAHGLIWALPRTSHWTAWALEDAGWEVRDVIHHVFGTGFPKSLDVSKAIDKAAGAEREVVGRRTQIGYPDGDGIAYLEKTKGHFGQTIDRAHDITAPATPEAAQWEGWGTALKPACENWILVRKPLSEPTVAANVLRWGCGGLNIDACRVEHVTVDGGSLATNPQLRDSIKAGENINPSSFELGGHTLKPHPSGRWPANLVLDEEAARLMDEVVGESSSPQKVTRGGNRQQAFGMGRQDDVPCYGDTGGPSRFFLRVDADEPTRFRYVAKASRRERQAGCEGLGERHKAQEYGLSESNRDNGDRVARQRANLPNRNHHPTVKPLALMRWLCRLVTPPRGTVLDPFAGSGSTLIAAGLEGFDYLGCEKDEEYAEIAEARLAHWMAQERPEEQMSLVESHA